MRTFLLLLVLVVLTCLPAYSEEEAVTLSPEHKQWLDVVHWIISDYERSAFLRLPGAKDREQFIQAFWDSRDPTPGTQKNEFKEEHYARFEYAKNHYGRETTLPGWKTDRGRIYILLGKPRFLTTGGSFDLQPIELWHYTGLDDYGLPGSIYLIFYREGGYGPYKLFSPLMDGIRELFEHREDFEARSEEELFEWLRTQVGPELAHASLSYIPTEGGYYGYQGKETGSLTTELVLSHLQNARNYDVDKRTYVEKLLNDRPEVNVYYTINNEGISDYVFWFLAPNGHFYIDYAVEYQPEKVDMGQYENEYYTSFTLDGQVTAGENIRIDEIKSTHEIHLDKSKFETVRKIPFQLQGRRPVIPGDLQMTFVIINNVSRQAVTFAHDLKIPDMANSSMPYITPILPIRLVEIPAEKGTSRVRPFQFNDQVYSPAIPAGYSAGGMLQVYHQILFPLKMNFETEDLTLAYLIKKGETVESEITEPLNIPLSRLNGQAVDIRNDVPLKGIGLGGKELVVELRHGKTVLSRSQPLAFQVHPKVNRDFWKFAIAIPDYDSPYHLTGLSEQYLRAGQIPHALALLETALKQHPNSLPIQYQMMRAALKAGKFEKVIQLGNPLEVMNPRSKELLWLMGWANYGLGSYENAVRFFERLRMEDPQRVEVLNLLADSYYRAEQPSKSLERIEQSLALNPNQKDILELKKSIESNLQHKN